MHRYRPTCSWCICVPCVFKTFGKGIVWNHILKRKKKVHVYQQNVYMYQMYWIQTAYSCPCSRKQQCVLLIFLNNFWCVCKFSINDYPCVNWLPINFMYPLQIHLSSLRIFASSNFSLSFLPTFFFKKTKNFHISILFFPFLPFTVHLKHRHQVPGVPVMHR